MNSARPGHPATERELCESGTGIRFGPFRVHLSTDDEAFARTFTSCYGQEPHAETSGIHHFRIAVRRKIHWRVPWRGQVVFRTDHSEPFEPYPVSHAFPMFEWGLNWCIATSAHQYLLLHSATVADEGNRAVILPAMPGSGKSTLAACLLTRGWRLLSDEFGILRPDDGLLLPMPRPIPLKNESIPFFRERRGTLQLGPSYRKTRKGTVVHVFPPAESLLAQDQPAAPRLILFPRFRKGAAQRLTRQPPHVAFTRLINNAFNYMVTAEDGFHAAIRLASITPAYELIFSDADAAMDQIAQLLAEDAA